MPRKKAQHLIGRLGRYLLANPLAAGLFAFSMALTPLLGIPFDWFSRVLLVFITLVKGYRAGLVIAAWCLLPAIALAVTFDVAIFIYVGLIVLLAWCCAVILRRFRSWSLLIEVISIVGAVVVLIFHFALPDITAWWMKLLTQYTGVLTERLALSVDNQEIFRSTIVPVLARYATGLQAAIVIFGTLFNLWVARAWQASIYSPGSLRKACYRVRVSRAFALLWLAAFGLGFFAAWPPLRDTLPVLTLPLLLAGISLMHAMASRYAYGVVAVIGFYIACLYLPYLLVIIILAAWADSWYDWRRRIKG